MSSVSFARYCNQLKIKEQKYLRPGSSWLKKDMNSQKKKITERANVKKILTQLLPVAGKSCWGQCQNI